MQPPSRILIVSATTGLKPGTSSWKGRVLSRAEDRYGEILDEAWLLVLATGSDRVTRPNLTGLRYECVSALRDSATGVTEPAVGGWRFTPWAVARSPRSGRGGASRPHPEYGGRWRTAFPFPSWLRPAQAPPPPRAPAR